VQICTRKSNGELDDLHPDSETLNINNQPGADAPSGRRGLTDQERRVLEDSGRPAEEIEALDNLLCAGTTRKPNPTLNLAVVFERERDQVLIDLGNKPLVSAKVFGTALVQRGAYHAVRGWNAAGDHLGKRGHNLPTVVFNGVRRYDISYIGADEVVKRQREQELRAMRPAVLALLIAEIAD
jgi:hypothetical protein